jgi:hypothetical protein
MFFSPIDERDAQRLQRQQDRGRVHSGYLLGKIDPFLVEQMSGRNGARPPSTDVGLSRQRALGAVVVFVNRAYSTPAERNDPSPRSGPARPEHARDGTEERPREDVDLHLLHRGQIARGQDLVVGEGGARRRTRASLPGAGEDPARQSRRARASLRPGSARVTLSKAAMSPSVRSGNSAAQPRGIDRQVAAGHQRLMRAP